MSGEVGELTSRYPVCGWDEQGAGSNKAPASEKMVGKDEGDSLLWKLFSGYQSRLTDSDQLGTVERMRWEALESAGTMPPGFISWFDDQVCLVVLSCCHAVGSQ